MNSAFVLLIKAPSPATLSSVSRGVTPLLHLPRVHELGLARRLYTHLSMAPKRKTAGKKAQADEAKKAKTTHADGDAKATVDSLLAENTSYCEELGIDLKMGGPDAVFQWLCCSTIFANRLSEKVRAVLESATRTISCLILGALIFAFEWNMAVWHHVAGMRAFCVV